MTAAPATTPPQYLFRELADLGNLVFAMLTGPQVTVRRWPAYYLVYGAIDQLCREVNRMAGCLSRGFIEPDGTVDSARIDSANACSARIDAHVATMVDLLVRIECHGLVRYGKPALKNIVNKHFSPKSAWYRAFRQQYRSGRVTPDGRVLERMVLPIDPHPACAAAGVGADNVATRQTFELVSARARILHGRTARNVQTGLNQLYAALGNFFVDHCPSVSDMLHPWMN